jgi:hypothetical protein
LYEAAAARAAPSAPRRAAHRRRAMAAPFGLASFVHGGVAALGAALTFSSSASPSPHAPPLPQQLPPTPARADGAGDAECDASSEHDAHSWAMEDVRWAPEAMVRRPRGSGKCRRKKQRLRGCALPALPALRRGRGRGARRTPCGCAG